MTLASSDRDPSPVVIYYDATLQDLFDFRARCLKCPTAKAQFKCRIFLGSCTM